MEGGFWGLVSGGGLTGELQETNSSFYNRIFSGKETATEGNR